MDTVELALVWQNAAAAANKLWTMAKKQQQQQNPAQLTEELYVKVPLGQLAPTPRWKEGSTGRIPLIFTNRCTNGVLTTPGVLVSMRTMTLVGSKVLCLLHVLRTSVVSSGNSLTGVKEDRSIT